MIAYKGFDKDLKCRGVQYEVGKVREEKEADLCSCGIHACEFPFDVFGYYPPSVSRYCEVDLDANEQMGDDSKRVGKRIEIKAEIGLPGLIKAGVKYIKNQVDWESGKKSNTGDWSAATNTGYQSAATNTGYQSAATNTGDQSAATNTGYHSAATNTGDHSAAMNTGYQSAATNTGYQSAATNTGNQSAATNTGNWSAAMNTGYQSAATNTGNWSAAIVEGAESVAIDTGVSGKAKGSLGCFIVLAEWVKINGVFHMIDVKSARVDGIKIKENTFYVLSDGEFKEAE